MNKFCVFLTLLIFMACKNGENEHSDKPDPHAPKILGFSIVATYPHDTASYTQGLQIYNGQLYEGTGNYGFSKLREVDLATGKTKRETALPKEFFGEGITILNDTVYQLTWREKKVFVYTLTDFKKIKEFDVNFEGWGLTNNGTHLIVTTGGSDLQFHNPADFSLVRTQSVTEKGSASFNLNELEYIDGYIYANQYQYPYIFKIDPANGEIVAKADLTRLWDRVKTINPDADVPNGIAYDPATKKIYITGKWWPELYEVQFSQ